MEKRVFDTKDPGFVRMQDLAFQGGTALGAVHAIGNGELMLYGRGPEWIQTIGMPYSAPSSMTMCIPKEDNAYCTSFRRPGTSSWQHDFDFGTIIDCASRADKCLARYWKLEKPTRFEIGFCGYRHYDVTPQFGVRSYLIHVPRGAYIYSDYTSHEESFMRLSLRGDCSVEETENGLLITLYGEGSLFYTGSLSCPDGADELRSTLTKNFEEILADADAEDGAFLRKCALNRKQLRNHALKTAVEVTADSVLLQIRAQQHVSGGVQAGHNYHLAYIRDQYGVFRGLLAGGAYDEAKKILMFYRDVFARSGHLSNAQAMGVDGVFHVHENDTSEITGYLLLQAADMLRITGDTELFVSLKPMLQWAVHQQLSVLHNGMLPFNGDETYIAGGFLPRTCINHGSFEATLLFITGGRRVLKAFEKLGLREEWMDEALAAIEKAEVKFDENFLRENDYTTNSLRRLQGLKEPEFRHGVCYGGDFFGWLHRADDGCYLCPKCAGRRDVQPLHREFHLKSTMLMPCFVDSTLIVQEKLNRQTEAFLTEFRRTGAMPSLPDGSRSTGYDYGLMLFAAKRAGLDADDVLEKMLSLKDECGMWSEYYNGTDSDGTRCRPWESAIDLAGAIEYLSL